MTSGSRAGSSAPVRVALVDDHRMFLDAMTGWLTANAPDITVVAAVTRFDDLLAHEAFPVDVVLLDLDLQDGLPPAVKITALATAGVATVVVSTLADHAQVRSCLAAGACGYVPKTEDAVHLVGAVRAAASGNAYITAELAGALLDAAAERTPALSPQELRALTLYASGLPLKSVARRMNVSYDTAKGYLDRVRVKYAAVGRGAQTKIELRQRALEDGHLLED